MIGRSLTALNKYTHDPLCQRTPTALSDGEGAVCLDDCQYYDDDVRQERRDSRAEEHWREFFQNKSNVSSHRGPLTAFKGSVNYTSEA